MIDVIVNALKDGLKIDLGQGGKFSDYIVQSVQMEEIKSADPDRTIAIREFDQTPQDFEIGQMSHTVSRYVVRLQLYAKNTNELEAQKTRRTLVRRVMKSLFSHVTPPVFQTYTNLCGLSDTTDGIVERLLKWYVSRVEYFSAEYQATFQSIAVITLVLDTETNYD